MAYRLLADLVLLLHLGFVLFVAAGALLLLRWRRLAWVHLPAAAWGMAIAFGGWVCPLTPLENWLRQQGGQSGYQGSFIDHYLMAILYPQELGRGGQVTLATTALLVNLLLYAWAFWPGREDPMRRDGEDAARDRGSAEVSPGPAAEDNP